MKTVALVALECAYLGGLSALIDVFAVSNHYITRQYSEQEVRGPTMQTRLLTLNGSACQTAGGRLLAADGAIAATPIYDLIYLAGFQFDDDKALDRRLAESGPLCAWLCRQHSAGALVAASTTAVLHLAHAGLLDDRRAAVPWWLEGQMRRRYPQVQLETIRDISEADGVFCAGSMQADGALALRLVERILSENVADWVARVTMIDTYASPWSPPSLSSPLTLRRDPLVGRAQHWLQRRFSQKPRMADLAAAMAVSERTLLRRFEKTLGMTPIDYLQTLRVEAAKQMLARSNREIERVSHLVGYSDVKFFNKVFRAKTRRSPSEYRREARALYAARGHLPGDPVTEGGNESG